MTASDRGADTGPSAGFRLVGEEVVHRGYAMQVTIGTFEAPDGHRFVRDIVHHPGAVGVVPLHADGTVTLVRQYRAAIGDDMLEIPAGLRDVAGEAPEVTARRELAEETGLDARQCEPIGTFHVAAGFSDEVVHLYLATELRPVANDLQGPEEQAMVIERHPFDEVVAILQQKYGSRLKDLVPSDASKTYLGGDDLSAWEKLVKIRARMAPA